MNTNNRWDRKLLDEARNDFVFDDDYKRPNDSQVLEARIIICVLFSIFAFVALLTYWAYNIR